MGTEDSLPRNVLDDSYYKSMAFKQEATREAALKRDTRKSIDASTAAQRKWEEARKFEHEQERLRATQTRRAEWTEFNRKHLEIFQEARAKRYSEFTEEERQKRFYFGKKYNGQLMLDCIEKDPDYAVWILGLRPESLSFEELQKFICRALVTLWPDHPQVRNHRI